MNYLAHFHLSHGDDDLLVGALLGDFVKGPLKGAYAPGLERGIALHRQIDAFSDTHTSRRRAQELFAPEFRRFSGIMLDIVCDHFLSLHWQRYHPSTLADFSTGIYHLLQDNPALHGPAKQQAERLIRYDVLGSFSDWRTVEAALERVSARFQRDTPLAFASQQLEQHYDQLDRIFSDLYPELVLQSRKIRQQLDD